MNHKARKRFGQNFLTDHTVIDHIIRAINPQVDDNIVEIGPGLGALTKPLLEAAEKLNVIELDRDVIPLLEKKCAASGELLIHNVDILKFDFNQLISKGSPLRIVGNLPYNISTPILFHLLNYADHIQDMFFMLQKEVVKRMAAGPDTGAYGRLSVMLQYRCKVTDLFDVPPESFDPAPKVDSAIVKLEPVEPAIKVNDIKLLEKLVKQAFSQRRKTIRNTLKSLCSAEQLEQAGIEARLRPENISVEQYVTLCNLLDDNATISTQQ